MKLLGALLLLLSAGAWCVRRRREGMLPVKLGRALLEDLAVFRYHVLVLRTPLPELLAGPLSGGPGGAWLWGPFAGLLSGEEAPLPECWREAVRGLPPPLEKRLAPLGPLLPAGGEALSEAIEETREELTGYLNEEAARQAVQGRLTAALSFAGAAFVILVLL